MHAFDINTVMAGVQGLKAFTMQTNAAGGWRKGARKWQPRVVEYFYSYCSPNGACLVQVVVYRSVYVFGSQIA